VAVGDGDDGGVFVLPTDASHEGITGFQVDATISTQMDGPWFPGIVRVVEVATGAFAYGACHVLAPVKETSDHAVDLGFQRLIGDAVVCSVDKVVAPTVHDQDIDPTIL